MTTTTNNSWTPLQSILFSKIRIEQLCGQHLTLWGTPAPKDTQILARKVHTS